MQQKWWRAVAVLALVGVFSTMHPATAASFDPKGQYQQLKSEHFKIYFVKELAAIAQRAAGLAEEVHAILSPKYQWKPLGRTVMVLTDSNDQANGLATVLPYNYLLIRVTAPEPNSSLGYYDDWLRLLIMHEYTHIIHMDQVGGIMRVPRLLFGKTISPNGVLPGWMREGLAVHEETLQTQGGRNRSSFSEMMLRTAIDQRNFPKIDQADGLAWQWPKYLSQYIYGGQFLDWLARKYGEDKLVQYQRRTARSLLFFMHNHQAKRLWGKSFYKLWKEWRGELRTKYQAQIQAVERDGLTELEVVTDDGETLTSLATSRDGTQLIYTSTSPHRANEIRLRDLRDGSERVLRRKQAATSASFAPDGHQIAYSATGTYRTYYNYSDIYLLDLAQGTVQRLTRGRRAREPDFSPDGKRLIYVVERAGRQRLATYRFETKKETILPIAAGPQARFSQPRWAPDGKSLAVSQWDRGQFDIYVYYPNGELVRRITQDAALDYSPAWDAQGRYLYFTSDRSGIANVYRYDRAGQRIARVSNVVTGLFEPTPLPDGHTLLAQYYHGKGFGIRRFRVTKTWATRRTHADGVGQVSPSAADTQDRSAGVSASTEASASPATSTSDYPIKKYSPFTTGLLLPRYVVPGLYATGNGLLLSAATGGFDPLQRHSWLIGGTYRTDAKYLGYFGRYSYNRLKPNFSLGITDYVADYGFNVATTSGGAERYYEKRLRGSASVAYPFKSQVFSLAYFIEKRNEVPSITPGLRAFFNLDKFAGLSATYHWGTREAYAASISPERGQSLTLNFSITDKVLGSEEKNEQQIFVGEARKFIPLWRHHVLALRMKGGITWGDPFFPGAFSTGGALGEGTLGGATSLYYFPLRGLPVSALSSSRAVVSSAEYRLPLISPQRGLGTWPFFLKNMHAAVFADYGNGWNAGDDTGTWEIGNFFLGTGLELRGDFVLGHGLPVTGRLGYGVIVWNRDRLGTSKDDLLGSPTKYGTMILQLGSSF